MNRYYYILAVLGVIIIGGFFVWISLKPSPLMLQGEIRAKHVLISPKILGRVEKMYVEEGESIKKGDLIVKLDAPSIEAKAYQAEAGLKAADAAKNKVLAGARSEEVIALLNLYEKALSAERLAYKSYERIRSLYDDGIISAQKHDEAKTMWEVAVNDKNAAKAKYEMAKLGARSEDKEAAIALSQQAEGAVKEVMSFIEDTVLDSPLDGEVSSVVVTDGELVTPGFPIVTITDISDMWASFYVREDLLSNLTVGTVINVIIPAISKENRYKFKIKYISKVGNYATWNATKTQGQFDIKTFLIKAYPMESIKNLRSGMSVLLYFEDEG